LLIGTPQRIAAFRAQRRSYNEATKHHNAMTTDTLILQKLYKMPESMKTELLHFAEFLLQKKENALSQEAEITSETKPYRQIGTMKGIVTYMADDFDAPLEDFAEYM
jgi:hypothetical protein